MSEKRQFDSTQIFEGEYFPETKKLHLTFRSGKKQYEYDNVEPETWAGLCEPGPQYNESHGRYFNQVIKGRYAYRKLEEAQPEMQPQPESGN